MHLDFDLLFREAPASSRDYLPVPGWRCMRRPVQKKSDLRSHDEAKPSFFTDAQWGRLASALTKQRWARSLWGTTTRLIKSSGPGMPELCTMEHGTRRTGAGKPSFEFETTGVFYDPSISRYDDS